MSNLSIVIFGQDLPLTVSTVVLILMLAQLVLVGIALIIFILLMVRKYAIAKRRQNILVTHAAESQTPVRSLVGIALDTVVVQREFKVGEPFNCRGLIVTAQYSAEPTSEQVTDYAVEAPAMDREGKPNVTVRYKGITAVYSIQITAEAARAPIGITLDTSAVRREFTVGEDFDCTGLAVTARFNLEPTSEQVTDFSVEPPAMDTAGEKTVLVRYGDYVELYSITVAEAPAERVLTGIELDLSVVKTDFIVGEPFDCEGLGVVACYSADPTEERVTDFTVEAPDLSKEGMTNVVVRYQDFVQTYPIFVTEGRALVGIALDTSAVRREFTVGEEFNFVGLTVIAQYDAEPMTEEVTDYEIYVPDLAEAGEYEVQVSYLGKTASYTVTAEAPAVEPEPVAEVQEAPAQPEEAPAEPAPVFDEAALGELSDEELESTLRFDKSFHAKLIQSDDDIKRFYSMIKNELLSYKKVHDRMSWKRETYKGGGQCVAKMSFRGNTLCLFLPIDPNSLADSRYKVEDASGNKSSEDTPCLFRIKNEKRAHLAIDLIGFVMETLGVERTEHEEVDYTEPYESTMHLIAKGLVRREYRTKEEESIFNKEE